MFKKLMITTALSGLMIGAAVAQSAPSADRPASPPPAAMDRPTTPPVAAAPSGSAQFVNSQKPDQFLASKFKGTDVLGSDDQKIGDVSDILFDKSGKIDAFIVSVGGFLGMGAKDIALAPASFTIVAGDKSKNEADKLKLAMNKDQLKQAANFEPYNPPRTTTGSGASIPRPAAQ